MEIIQEPVGCAHLPYIVGNYYTSHLFQGDPSGTAITTGTIFLMPFLCYETHTFTQIMANTTSAGTNMRLGIWDYVSGALLVDSGNIDVSGAAADKTATISVRLIKDKWYWLGETVAANTSTRFFGANSLNTELGWANGSTGNYGRGQIDGFTYGALTDLGTVTLSTNASPAIFLLA